MYVYISFNPSLSTIYWLINPTEKEHRLSPGQAFIGCKSQAHEHGEKEEGQDTSQRNIILE